MFAPCTLSGESESGFPEQHGSFDKEPCLLGSTNNDLNIASNIRYEKLIIAQMLENMYLYLHLLPGSRNECSSLSDLLFHFKRLTINSGIKTQDGKLSSPFIYV